MQIARIKTISSQTDDTSISSSTSQSGDCLLPHLGVGTLAIPMGYTP